MIEEILKHFEEITKIPRCSHKTSEMKNYIIEFAKKYNYEVKTDEAGNILCSKNNPKVCLQAHYDMVCVGDVNPIILSNHDGYLSAKNSSLGADNGIAVAMMMYFMSKKDNLECLFTNDEEVGLIGARNLNLQLKSDKLLNLDSEEEACVCIGCAGGLEISARTKLKKTNIKKNFKCYEVKTINLPGGHSGIDIDKAIPNAIKVLSTQLAKNKCKIISFDGGVSINAIPATAKAKVFCKNFTSDCEFIEYKEIDSKESLFYKKSKKILNIINAFSSGVKLYDYKLKMPHSSINLGILKLEDDELLMRVYARSMSIEEMQNLKFEVVSFLKLADFKLSFDERTTPWQPKKSEFSNEVENAMKEVFNKCHTYAIHAGLECAELAKTQTKQIQTCSIGPNIHNPHSTQEKCEINSIQNIAKVVELVLNKN